MIRMNEVKAMDNRFEFLPLSEYTVLEVKQTFIENNFEELYEEDEGDEFRFYHGIDISLDPSKTDYNRRVYSLMNLLGDVGGVLGICTLIGGFFVRIFFPNALMAAMIGQLYETRTKPT